MVNFRAVCPSEWVSAIVGEQKVNERRPTMNSTTNTRSGLVLTWVAVTDVRGGERLEARWVEAPQLHAPHATHAA